MKAGDIIEIETGQGSFRYKMTEQLIVAPNDTYVLDDEGDNRLTLTACHPKLSSKQRIVVHAVLVGSPVDRLPGQDDEAGVRADRSRCRAPRIDEFESEPIARFPGAWWGARLRRGLGGRPPDGVVAAPEPAPGPGAALPRRHPDLPASCSTCSSSRSATRR